MLKRTLFRLKNDSTASVTIEASILLPTMLLILFSLVFFSMYLYHRFVLLDTAVYTAKQRAETWGNSESNMENGYLIKNIDDGLYWRLFNDFSQTVKTNKFSSDNEEISLVQKKLSVAARFIRNMLAGGVFKTKSSDITVRYNNMLVKGTVTVNIVEEVIVPLNWLSKMVSPKLVYEAEADLADPVEFIRNISLVERYSGQLMANNLNGFPEIFKSDKQRKPRTKKLIASTGIRYGQHVKVFHYPGCRYINRIKKENLTQFDSEEEANNNGFYLCWDCAKRWAVNR